MSSRYFQLYHIRRGSTRYLAAPRVLAANGSAPSTRRAGRAAAEIPIVQVAFVSRCLLVDGDDDRSGAVGLKQFDLIARRGEVLDRIELRPARTGGARRHLLNRNARAAGENHRRAGGGRSLVHAGVAIGMQIALPRAGRDENRILHPDAEDFGRGVDGVGRRSRPFDELHPVERLAIAAKRELRVAAVRHVVVAGERHVREADRLEVERGHHLVDPRHATVILERTGVELRAQERRAGEHAGQAQQGLAAGQAVPPAIVTSAQESSAAFARRHTTQLPSLRQSTPNYAIPAV